jgi:thioredoxin-like negative regulator of GroEL
MSQTTAEERRPTTELGSFDVVCQAIGRGRSLTLLGNPKAAVPVLQEALALQPSSGTHGQAVILLYLAEAYLAQGEMEEACAIVGKVAHRSGSVARLANSMATDLQKKYPKHPAVRGLEEQLRGLGA